MILFVLSSSFVVCFQSVFVFVVLFLPIFQCRSLIIIGHAGDELQNHTCMKLLLFYLDETDQK